MLTFTKAILKLCNNLLYKQLIILLVLIIEHLLMFHLHTICKKILRYAIFMVLADDRLTVKI